MATRKKDEKEKLIERIYFTEMMRPVAKARLGIGGNILNNKLGIGGNILNNKLGIAVCYFTF